MSDEVLSVMVPMPQSLLGVGSVMGTREATHTQGQMVQTGTSANSDHLPFQHLINSRLQTLPEHARADALAFIVNRLARLPRIREVHVHSAFGAALHRYHTRATP